MTAWKKPLVVQFETKDSEDEPLSVNFDYNIYTAVDSFNDESSYSSEMRDTESLLQSQGYEKDTSATMTPGSYTTNGIPLYVQYFKLKAVEPITGSISLGGLFTIKANNEKSSLLIYKTDYASENDIKILFKTYNDAEEEVQGVMYSANLMYSGVDVNDLAGNVYYTQNSDGVTIDKNVPVGDYQLYIQASTVDTVTTQTLVVMIR